MINKTIWLAVDQQTREKIAKDFGMKKTEGCQVVGNQVKSDGYGNEMLMKITEKGLRERVGKTQKTLPKEFMKLWEYYVADMSDEPIKYSNDEKFSEAVKEQIEEPKYKITRTEKEIKELSEVIKKNSEPKKKGGRPKGSKNKK